MQLDVFRPTRSGERISSLYEDQLSLELICVETNFGDLAHTSEPIK